MDGDDRQLFVLSADDVCCARVEGLCRQGGYPPPRRVDDPTELQQALRLRATGGGERREAAGIVLDLTTPVPVARAGSHAPHTVAMAQAAKLAWCVAMLGAALAVAPAPSLLLVTTNAYIGDALRRCGLAVATQVAPDADEAAWRRALDRLMAHTEDEDGAPVDPRPDRATLPPNTLRLRPDLWLDWYDSTLRDAEGACIGWLTRQEAALVAALADPPRRYVSAAELVRRLARPGAGDELGWHCVEQVVSELRRKLGEGARGARLLRTRRGVGYGLFPEPE